MMKIIKSEFYRVRHTWIPWVHVVLPIAYAVVFYGISKVTALKNYEKIDIIQNYFGLLGAVLPIVIGVITFKEVDMEVSAGCFQVLLSTTKSRSKAYGGKLLALLIGLLCAIGLSTAIFGLLFGNQTLISWIIESLLIFIGCVAIYMIHLPVSILFVGGASIALGFVESLIALISITSLGEKIWYFLPCAWASRLSATYVVGSQMTDKSYLYHELMIWCFVAIPFFLIFLIGFLIWFCVWDVKSFNE